MNKRKSVSVMLSLLYVSSILGCSSEPSQSSGTDPSKEAISEPPISKIPITLTVFQKNAQITDEEFNRYITEPVKKKYPHITMTLIRDSEANRIENMLTAGNVPDIFFAGHNNGIREFRTLNLLEDLDSFVKKNSLDLTMFETGIIEDIRSRSDKKQLYALPFSENFSALFYNKDMFNKYGVSYPKDAMAWEDIITLGREISSKSSGQDMALNAGTIIQFGSPLSPPTIDPKLEKAALQTPQWKRIFEVFKDVYQIPGNTYVANVNQANQMFYEGKIAMLASYGVRLSELEQVYKSGNQMNWDLATYPIFKEAPDKRRNFDLHILMVSALSKNKEQAFQAISAIYSKENQLSMTRTGRLSPLKDLDVRNHFAVDMNTMKGKDIKVIYKTKATPLPPDSDYTTITNNQLTSAVKRYIDGAVDVNTALREAEELSNKDIETEKKKK